MEQIFIVEVAKMTKGLSTIKTITELAPFIGLIGTVIGIWMTFKSLGVNPNSSAMAEGIYVALTTTIMGLFVVIILLPIYTYIQGLISVEMDKIELATKMTNWGFAVVKVRVEANVECAVAALQEAEGVVNTRLISDPYANIKVSFKPSMLDKSISNIILEKCNVNAEITESKLRQQVVDMAIDVKAYKKRFLDDQNPNINLVPFIDILFTIMIFLVVTSNFSAVDTPTQATDSGATGKPNVTDVSGDAEQYVVPVANLHKVTVNGVDRSDAIVGGAVGVQAKVMDEGQISIKPGEIIIQTPNGISPDKAVQRPKM